MILIGSIISGFIQSATVLATIPLMKYLNIVGEESKNIFAMKYFDKIIIWFGIDSSLLSVLVFMVIATWTLLYTRYLIEIYSAKVSAKITRNLRSDIIVAVLNAEWLYYVNKQAGSVVHSVITETGKTVSGYNDSIRFFSSVIQVCVLLVTTFFVSLYMSMLVLLTGVFIIIIFSPFIAYSKQISHKTGLLLKTITSRLIDCLHGLKPLKAMNNDRFIIPLLYNETVALEDQQVKGFMVAQLPTILRESLFILLIAIGTYYAVAYSIISVASLVPMILLYRLSVSHLGVAQGCFQAQKGMEPFYISLKNNIEQAKRMAEEWLGELEPVFNESIIIKNMNYSYSSESVLKNVSMKIKKKYFIAIMGESGGGKTTFADILCGLYSPSSGEILIDGKNMHLLDINKWRKKIGYIPQDLFLFHDSIMHNVNLGDTQISKNNVEIALKDAGAWDFVSKLPEGMNTNIGEQGIRLSGGQRQRLSIARAIVRKPELLILDEATTALDPKTEKKILQTIRNLTEKGITIIAVSHQKSVIDIADRVYKLEKGCFEELH